MPAISFAIVDFPLPLGPVIAINLSSSVTLIFFKISFPPTE